MNDLNQKLYSFLKLLLFLILIPVLTISAVILFVYLNRFLSSFEIYHSASYHPLFIAGSLISGIFAPFMLLSRKEWRFLRMPDQTIQLRSSSWRNKFSRPNLTEYEINSQYQLSCKSAGSYKGSPVFEVSIYEPGRGPLISERIMGQKADIPGRMAEIEGMLRGNIDVVPEFRFGDGWVLNTIGTGGVAIGLFFIGLSFFIV